MTTIGISFFVERKQEIYLWSERGYVEIHEFLKTTEYTLEDLLLIGVVEKSFLVNPPGMGYGLNGDYPPSADWENEFHRGQYLTWYIKIETMDLILKILKNSLAAC